MMSSHDACDEDISSREIPPQPSSTNEFSEGDGHSSTTNTDGVEMEKSDEVLSNSWRRNNLAAAALRLSMESKDLEDIEKLLVDGADLAEVDSTGKSVLKWAAALDDAEFTRLLLSHGIKGAENNAVSLFQYFSCFFSHHFVELSD